MGDWEALPQRKRNRRHISTTDDDTIIADDEITRNNHINRIICDHQQEVDDAIQKRTIASRAINPLGALDGARGEFYEYLDHTADVQLHAWGVSMQMAFENIVPCMFNYATDLSVVGIDHNQTIEFTVQGHDLYSLLYKYLDEFLFHFCSDGFCCKAAKILSFDKESFSITVRGLGEIFDLSKHTQGTEVKAITYSNMQIHEVSDKTDLYVIIDI